MVQEFKLFMRRRILSRNFLTVEKFSSHDEEKLKFMIISLATRILRSRDLYGKNTRLRFIVRAGAKRKICFHSDFHKSPVELHGLLLAPRGQNTPPTPHHKFSSLHDRVEL